MNLAPYPNPSSDHQLVLNGNLFHEFSEEGQLESEGKHSDAAQKGAALFTAKIPAKQTAKPHK